MLGVCVLLYTPGDSHSVDLRNATKTKTTTTTTTDIVQELCESRGGRPGLSVLTSLLASVVVNNYWTVLRYWSQLVPNMSTDIWGHWASLPHHRRRLADAKPIAANMWLSLMLMVKTYPPTWCIWHTKDIITSQICDYSYLCYGHLIQRCDYLSWWCHGHHS